MSRNKTEPAGNVKILIVDDDAGFVADLTSRMSGRYDFISAGSGDEALAVFASEDIDAVLLDIGLGEGLDGFEVLERMRASAPYLPIIMVTDDTTSSSAVAAIRKGASDYIDKQPKIAALEKFISAALERQRLTSTNRALRLDIDEQTGTMIGDSPAMRTLRGDIHIAVETPSPVLIVGETGTGKELVAREIHRISCPDAPFRPINCAAVPDGLYEARLFGQKKGSHSTATEAAEGEFEVADGGVLFLDEITEIDTSTQAKLLRVMQDGEYERVGSVTKRRFRGKILASTNKDLKRAVRGGVFREDLYYRFSACILRVPPLRERRGDIPLLAKHFLRKKSDDLKKPKPPLSDEILMRLCSYDWPGNVRELENAIEAFVVRGTFSFPMDGLSGDSPEGERTSSGWKLPPDILALPYQEAKSAITAHFKKQYIESIMAACEGDVHKAAERMGLSRFGLQKIMKEIRM